MLLEREGTPATVLITEPFQVTIASAAAKLGAPGYHSLVVPHPVWGKDDAGQTWEYMYFVTEPLTLGLAYERLAALCGYSPDYVVLGFTVLGEERSNSIIDALQLLDD